MTSQPLDSLRIPRLDGDTTLGIWTRVSLLVVLIGILEATLHFLDLPRWLDLAADLLLVWSIVVAGFLRSFGISTSVASALAKREEEIRQGHEQRIAVERRFQVLNEYSQDGIVLLSPDGSFLYASPSTRRLIGYAPEELLGRNGFDFLHPDDRVTAAARFGDILQQPGGSAKLEVRVRQKDGSWRWHEAVIRNMLAEPHVQALVENYRDITQRKLADEALRKANEALQATRSERQRAEEALCESQVRFVSLMASVTDAVITLDEMEHVVAFNAAAERTFRIPAADIIGRSAHHLIPEQLRPPHEPGIRDVSRMNLEWWWSGVLARGVMVRGNGEEFPIQTALSQVEVGGRRLYTIALRDITEQKQATEQLHDARTQLHALARRLLAAREEDRVRTVKGIRDSPGQALTGLIIDLAWLAARIPAAQSHLLAKVWEMSALAEEAIRATQRLVTDLRPGVLDDFGLVAALEWLAQDIRERLGIQCEFSSSRSDFPLDPEVSTALFRICQESLANVLRHAHARRVIITLRDEPGGLILAVTDNGRGITEQELISRTSVGLLSMREQALLFGGQVAISGRPGEGTTVTVWVPISEPAPEDGSGRP
jgi:PAS domain S-box-containing protein